MPRRKQDDKEQTHNQKNENCKSKKKNDILKNRTKHELIQEK